MEPEENINININNEINNNNEGKDNNLIDSELKQGLKESFFDSYKQKIIQKRI